MFTVTTDTTTKAATEREARDIACNYVEQTRSPAEYSRFVTYKGKAGRLVEKVTMLENGKVAITLHFYKQ